MTPEKIYKEFTNIIENPLILNKKQRLISYLKEQIKDVTSLLETIFRYPLLADYLDQEWLSSFWNNVLDKNLIAIDENVYARTQKNISSFKIIVGFYLFFKVDTENLEDRDEQHYIDLGMEYSSYHCFHLKLIYLTKEYKKDPSSSLFAKIISLAQQGVKYEYPGYLLYARTCWEFSIIDPSLIFIGLIALYVAKNLEKNSVDIIHNAYFGKDVRVFEFKQVDEIIQAYLATRPLNKEKIAQAQDIANSNFLRY